MTLDHVGIATASPAARTLFEALLGAAPYQTETVESEGVTTVFFGDGGRPGAAPKLELLETDTPDSPVGRFLASRGPGVHHLAFEVRSLDAALQKVDALGLRRLGEPRAGADNTRIAFLHPKDTAGVLVELLETPRMPRETRHVETPAGTVAVHVSGPAEAPALVVLHGALGSTDLETDRLVRLWERRFRVHAVDFRGHGQSSPLERAPVWDDFTSDVLAATEALPTFRIFGFSLGGAVALAVASRLGTRVERLAVHGVNVRWSRADVERMVRPMQATLAGGGRWAERLEQTHGAGWERLVGQLAAFTEGLPEAHMPKSLTTAITASTLVSAGAADRYFDVAHAVALFREIPDADLWIVPGLDHPIQGVDAAAFARTVGDHLAG